MTCIVAICEKNKVYMGGDSAAVEDRHYLTHIKNPKVFANGLYLVGYTSSFRMGQLIEFATLPEPPKDNLYKFMATTFVESLRELFSKGGYLKKDCERESSGNFLIGVRGRLFECQDDLSILEHHCGFASCGSGESVALGSLYTSDGPDWTPENRLLLALNAAQQFTTSVREPFYTYEN